MQPVTSKHLSAATYNTITFESGHSVRSRTGAVLEQGECETEHGYPLSIGDISGLETST